MVEAVLFGMLDQLGRLDMHIVPNRPDESHTLNLPELLQAHLSHPANTGILGQLKSRAKHHSRAATQLLQILAAPLFDQDQYSPASAYWERSVCHGKASCISTADDVACIQKCSC